MEYYLAVIKKKMKEILIDISTLCVNFKKKLCSVKGVRHRDHISYDYTTRKGSEKANV